MKRFLILLFVYLLLTVVGVLFRNYCFDFIQNCRRYKVKVDIIGQIYNFRIRYRISKIIMELTELNKNNFPTMKNYHLSKIKNCKSSVMVQHSFVFFLEDIILRFINLFKFFFIPLALLFA